MNPMFVSGHDFETPIPMIEGPVRGGQRIAEVAKPFPPTGYRTLDARTYYFYLAFLTSPAMATRMAGVGSQYLVATVDAKKEYFDGGSTYKVTLPKDIPQAHFWSLTVYNHHHLFEVNDLNRYSLGTKNQDLQFNPDGSLTLYFSTKSPGKEKETNWVPAPAGTFSLYIRAYWGKEAILDGSWVPPKIERVK